MMDIEFFICHNKKGEYMKFTKMSLVAALLIGSSAFAIENVKVGGDAKLFYSTTDATGGTANTLAGDPDGSLFEPDSSAADVALSLDVSADLFKNDLVSISAGAGYTVLTTLGLENNLVSNVWGGAHTATAGNGAAYPGALGGAKVENASWLDEAWVAVTAGNSTAKLGRMELDTPLAFTETWSVEKNTFEAAVLINQDIPDTTIVGAWIGNGNGTETFGQDLNSNVSGLALAMGGVVNGDGKFGTYGTDGAFGLGVVNNSFKPLTAQAWYYDVQKVAKATWLQADLNIEGIMVGAQYSTIELHDAIAANVDSDVFAVMVGYEMKDMLTAKLAYSQVGEDFSAGWNTATGSGASKLYTESWWTYGEVTSNDTSAMALTLESPVNGVVDLGLYAVMTDDATTADEDMTEITLTAGKSFGPLDTSLAYIYTDYDVTGVDAVSTVQVFLTLNY